MARTLGANSKARPAKDIRQRAWQAMRILKVFTAYDIQATAEVGRDNLKKYIQALAETGYLRKLKERQSGRSMGHAKWRLVRDSGPKHPIARRDGSGVFDPNTGESWSSNGRGLAETAPQEVSNDPPG